MRLQQLVEYRMFVTASMTDRLQRELESAPSAPSYWQTDVRAIVEAQAKALVTDNEVPRLAEWSGDLDRIGCAHALSAELESFAVACEHWPALWQHAAEFDTGMMGHSH